jgi:hypothetical protein
MGLADALKAERDRGHAKRCNVCTLLGAMPKDDRAALTEALEDKALTSSAIYRALAAEGYDVKTHSLARHRRRECQTG